MFGISKTTPYRYAELNKESEQLWSKHPPLPSLKLRKKAPIKKYILRCPKKLMSGWFLTKV